MKFIAFKTSFVITTFFDLDINLIDIKTVFFHIFIDQLIYKEILKDTKIEAIKNIVYKLLKVLYNLKQSLCFWYKYFSIYLFEKQGLKYIYVNHNIFVLSIELKYFIFCLFVNIIKIMVPKNSKLIERVKAELTISFFITNLSSISYYLELKIDQD